jgi:hypothetical protein
VDDLAWIWVLEKDISKSDGKDLPDTWVGFRRDNSRVQESLPQELREYLEEINDWFKMLENYRHAVAHRIPPYIPPYIIRREDAEAYSDIERQMHQATDIEEYDRLQAEQERMQYFAPVIQHSFEEQARPLVFHPQLLANFNTVEELGSMLLDALTD